MQLAQVNVAEAVAPLSSPQLRGFVLALDRLDELARRSPGFVWRPRPEDVTVADLALFGDPDRVVPNLSVWASAEALLAFTYGGEHLAAMRRRRQWFRPLGVASVALWWAAGGERPSFAEDAPPAGTAAPGWSDRSGVHSGAAVRALRCRWPGPAWRRPRGRRGR
jgi:Domain of unknown function (DUF3291)